MTDKEYQVTQPINHDRKSYLPGSKITLSDDQAASLKGLGAIEGGQEIQVATVKADGGKNLSPDEGEELANAGEVAPTSSREDELKALFASQGWRPIAKIAEPLGISKPDGGWDEAISLIVQREQEVEQG